MGASLAAALAGGMVGSIGIEAAKVDAFLGERLLAAWGNRGDVEAALAEDLPAET
jgi:hypothetical protein